MSDESIASLASIFEDYYPCSDLLAALEQHHGNLQSTIEYLLAHQSSHNQSEPVQHHLPSPSSFRRRRRSDDEDRLLSQSRKNQKIGSLDSWLTSASAISDQSTPNDHQTPVIAPSSRAAESCTGRAATPPSDSSLSQPSHPSSCLPPPPLRSFSQVLGLSYLSSSQSVPSTSKPKPRRALPPLFLSSPSQVSSHLPCCSLFHNVLSKDLASRLYLRMIDDCQGRGPSLTPWIRNRWWLNGHEVQSPHSTAFFIAQPTSEESLTEDYHESAQYWYAGKALEEDAKPRYFVDEMVQAKRAIEVIVNNLLANDPETLLKAQRDPKLNPVERYAEEWHGSWRANVAASNCYRGSKESVGWHSDQLTYLGPYPTIASLSLGTSRQFRLRPVPHLAQSQADGDSMRTYSISLPHNSLLVMHAGCQERFKHCVPTQTALDVFKTSSGCSTDTHIERINITFRFYRPDFRPTRSLPENFTSGSSKTTASVGTPRCQCGTPTILRADQKGKAAAASQDLHCIHPIKNSSSSPPAHPRPAATTPALRFFWQCQAAQQDPTKGCKFFKFLDLKGEQRGPCLGDQENQD